MPDSREKFRKGDGATEGKFAGVGKVDAVFEVAWGDLVHGDFSGDELAGKRAGKESDPHFSDVVARGKFSWR